MHIKKAEKIRRLMMKKVAASRNHKLTMKNKNHYSL